jgi:hypothetical protein
MKLRFLALLAVIQIFISVVPAAGTEGVKAKTDQRIELMSIVFRLAGSEEYSGNQFKSYVNDIDKWFAPYKNHPVVEMAKRLRMTRGVSYDAVMSMAIHLGQPPDLNPTVPFKSASLDKRWGTKGANKFLKLLKDFYRESRFDEFYGQHKEMYQIAETRMNKVLESVNFSWFEQFYGVQSSGRFNLVLGIGNGGGNYGPKAVTPDGSEDLYAIIGTWMVDAEGNPNYNNSVLGTIIHEFNHSFANPLVDGNVPILEESGKALFHPVREQMSKMAYGNWKTVMYESLVRASTIHYFADNKGTESQIKRLVINEMANGFIWTDKLVDLLGDYKSKRDIYPTLTAFMPRIATLYASLAPNIDQIKSDYDSKCARVEAIEPFSNGDSNVDPALTEIRIRFDKPMNPLAGYSINYGKLGAEHFALSGSPAYSEDGRYLNVKVSLKPDWDYSFVLTSKSFRTKDEFPLVGYEVKFKTRK